MPDTTARDAGLAWFTADPAPALIGLRCTSCGTYSFPPVGFTCPNPACASSDLDPTPLSARGTIWSFVVNHYPPPPPGLADGPYGVAAVHLSAEQLVVLGRLADGVDLDALSIGDEVELVIEPIIPGEDESVWKWRPVA